MRNYFHIRKISNLTRVEWLLYCCLFTVALLLRIYDLDARAMHHDESLHAYYSWELYQGSGLTHNPMLHGPLQMQLTSLIFFLFGDTDVTARILYVAAGTILVILPIFFRDLLGKHGAIMVSILLSISPSMVYFSRFARNDILMAVFTFGMVITMWKYLVSGNKKNLYLMSALLALSFSTKENAYLLVGTLGLYLTLSSIHESWPRKNYRDQFPSLSYPRLVFVYALMTFKTLRNSVYTHPHSRAFTVLIVLISLTLPQWSAFTGIFQETILLRWSNIILVSGEGASNIGMPTHGGKLLAFLVVFSLIVGSMYIGYKWHWKTWWKCAAIFYLIWLSAYTTFFTNIFNGVQSGIWQSLGYWIVQQGEARGGQPTHYYLTLIPIYEYLPAIFSVLASLYFLKHRTKFNLFLIYWTVITLFLYTIASEKMPWLLINISLPLIVLSGKFLGDLFSKSSFNSKPNLSQCMIYFVPTISLIIAFSITKYSSNLHPIPRVFAATIMLSLFLAGFVLVVRFIQRYETHILVKYLCAGFATILLLLTIRTTIYTNFVNSDIPIEMLVYTQTSPDLLQINNKIKNLYVKPATDNEPLIIIDQTNGFTWPWSWYLRNYTNVKYPKLQSESYEPHEQASIVVVHSSNHLAADKALSENYKKVGKIPHRWWFPEHTYRDLNAINLVTKLTDTKHWNIFLEYWLFRKGVGKSIGSEDAYIYTSNTFPNIDFVGDSYRK
jgi:predicted membrane-bound mannosyltransferase